MKDSKMLRTLMVVVLSVSVIAGSASAALSGNKDSSAFEYKWEMDFNPWDTANVDLDASGGRDWIQSSSSHFTLGGGLLTCTSATNGALLANDDNRDEALWPVSHINSSTGFTTEFKIRINSQQAGSEGAFKIQVGLYDSIRTDSVLFATDHVKYYVDGENDVVLDTSDNTDGFHTFRIARHENDPAKTSIWRDGVLIADGIDCAWQASPHRFYIGDIDGSVNGTYDMDYLRIDGGAWAVPEPATLCLLGVGGMLLRRRKK